MKLFDISAKQKQIHALGKEFAEIEDLELKGRAEETLKRYRHLILKIWEDQSNSEEDFFALTTLERELRQLSEESRLLARPAV